MTSYMYFDKLISTESYKITEKVTLDLIEDGQKFIRDKMLNLKCDIHRQTITAINKFRVIDTSSYSFITPEEFS